MQNFTYRSAKMCIRDRIPAAGGQVPEGFHIPGAQRHGALIQQRRIIEAAAADLLTLLFGGEEKGQAHQVAADIGDGEGDLVAIPHLFHPNFIFLLAAQQGKHIIQGSLGALPHGGGQLLPEGIQMCIRDSSLPRSAGYR